ncbi:hypothetical protein VdG1_04102 [Verticillium dahliae VDG1]|nr:hypothetical protein VdG1_04102 [Verticillium dahliae VDG1]
MAEGEQQKTPVVAEAHNVDTFHLEEYQKLYKESITDPTKFWGEKARELLSWYTDFQTVRSGSFEGGDTAWFVEGTLNACYNLVDRHAYKDPNRVAIIYEADEPDGGRKVTYQQLLRDVSHVAWVLREMGVRKGDTVAIYLPMIPEALVAILACIRLGAVHSVVFAGFSADSLRDRVIDGKSRVVITSDEGKRGGKLIGTKKIVDDALKQCPDVSHPIAAEIWKWYFETVGKEEAHVVDTYWQTETGSNVITPLAGVTPTKPGSASLPFFGIEPAIIDPVSGDEIHGNDVEGVLAFKQPWPSMARTVYGAHKRYMDTYLNAALLEHHSIAEAAVVGVADELTGQAVNAFAVFIVPDLPKTRSGKIMRRILRKILAGEEDQLGDITTLSDPSIVEKIINLVHEAKGKK